MKAIFSNEERYVGRDYGSNEYEITPELVDRYVKATGDDNPWYHRESPLGPPIAPALIIHSAVFRTHDWYLPNIYGNLHARQEWSLFWPVTVGDRLRTRSLLVDRYIRRNREYVVNEVIVTNRENRIVSVSRTHQSFLMGEQAESEGFVVDRSREKDKSRNFHIGERGGEPFEVPMRKITEEMCMAFSGPALNYHTNREAALKLGFPDIVVQGMLSICLVSEMMTRRFGLGWYCGGRMDLRLVNVLWGNETTGPRGLVVESRPEGEHTRAECEVWCDKSDGIKTIVGTASALEM